MSDVRDVIVKLFGSMHVGAFRATKGRVLDTILGMPAVMLTTTGRRSGEPRSVMLTAIDLSPDRVVLVASNGGLDRHPDWYHNACANPLVTVTRAGEQRPMRARVASPAERAHWWPVAVEAYRGYGLYQLSTERDIPVVILEG